MVDRNQQVAPQFLDALAQRGQLRPVVPVAGKQDQAANQRMAQATAVHGTQLGAFDVDDEGGVLGHGLAGMGLGGRVSTTQKLVA